jgi:DNA-binding MarR family transcriptional regulator
MQFRVALEILNQLGNANPKEFAEFCMKNYDYINMPVKNAGIYLYKLYKMGLASRIKDKNSLSSKKSYRYRVTQKGKNYLKWLKKTKLDRLLKEAYELHKIILKSK